MWQLILTRSQSTLVDISTVLPELSTLPKRKEIAEKHGFYTKETSCSHTFFLNYNGEELEMRLVWITYIHVHRNGERSGYWYEGNDPLRDDHQFKKIIRNFAMDMKRHQ